jgi:hypothetical protein
MDCVTRLELHESGIVLKELVRGDMRYLILTLFLDVSLFLIGI